MFRVQKKKRTTTQNRRKGSSTTRKEGVKAAPCQRRMGQQKLRPGEERENHHFTLPHFTLRCLHQFDLLSFSYTSWISFDDFWETTREQHQHPIEGKKTATRKSRRRTQHHPQWRRGKGSTTKRRRRPTSTTQNCSSRSPLLGGAAFSLLSLGKFSIKKTNQDFLSFKNSNIVKKEKSRLNFEIFFFEKVRCVFSDSQNGELHEKAEMISAKKNRPGHLCEQCGRFLLFFCPSGTSEAFPLKRSFLGDFWESQHHTNSMLLQRNLMGFFFDLVLPCWLWARSTPHKFCPLGH